MYTHTYAQGCLHMQICRHAHMSVGMCGFLMTRFFKLEKQLKLIVNID